MAIPYSRTLAFGIPWYSVLIVLGVLAAVFLAQKEEKRLALPADTAIDLALVVIPCGIVGARLYYVFMSWENFAAHPISILYVWQGGVAIYGAVIGGALGLLVYSRIKKLSFFTAADLIAPGLLLAQAIGRWGNYFNMEAYGPAIVDQAYQFFPLGVLIPVAGGYQWHMATFFYESMWNLLGFCVLWGIRKRQRCRGNVFLWYMLIYGSGRFVIEQLRQDSLYIGSIRASQYLSLLLCAVSAAVLLRRAYRTRENGWRGLAFPLALLAAGAAMARWFASGAGYGAALAVMGVCGVLVLLGGSRTKRHTIAAAMLLVLILALDAAGLLSATAAGGDAQFSQLLHTLLCSMTLPALTGWLIWLAPAADVQTKEGESQCPSET